MERVKIESKRIIRAYHYIIVNIFFHEESRNEFLTATVILTSFF